MFAGVYRICSVVVSRQDREMKEQCSLNHKVQAEIELCEGRHDLVQESGMKQPAFALPSRHRSFTSFPSSQLELTFASQILRLVGQASESELRAFSVGLLKLLLSRFTGRKGSKSHIGRPSHKH